MTSIATVLIANRGEIAVRIMRTARRMGVRTVAVYSDADAQALHVREADSAVHIGPSTAAQSYLNIEAILHAAAKSGADAIHPGYGFLSENQDFARACRANGLIFIGPNEHAIDVMGDKARAKEVMLAAGVPCLPGYQGDDQSIDRLLQEAEQLGAPLMVKAAAGGGGRGMRLVTDMADVAKAIPLAQGEAQNAFGASDLILERALLNPRHVEIQVFADQYGNSVYLGERDCSIQRRHQKVVEESPCPVLTPELRSAMGKAAVDAATAVNYVGAGTVEFLLDTDGAFYFLEMNTRLQVEHPVTELVTGLDLVEWQLRVAQGEQLPLEQASITLNGHAIEVRLYAENPAQGFLPATGKLACFDVPTADNVRVDTGVETGDQISPYYDAMMAKIIGYGATRDDARRSLQRSLEGSTVFGVDSNRDFLIDVLTQPCFVEGQATTAFINKIYPAQVTTPAIDLSLALSAATLLYRHYQRQYKAQALSVSAELLDWSSTGSLASRICLGHEQPLAPRLAENLVAHCVDGALPIMVSTGSEPGSYSVGLGEASYAVTLLDDRNEQAFIDIDGLRQHVGYQISDAGALHIRTATLTTRFIDRARLAAATEDAVGDGHVAAPMHGQLVSVDVALNQSVEQGQRLAILEAMKMQHEIIAPVAGVVTEIALAAGTQVAASEWLMTITPDTPSDAADD